MFLLVNMGISFILGGEIETEQTIQVCCVVILKGGLSWNSPKIVDCLSWCHDFS